MLNHPPRSVLFLILILTTAALALTPVTSNAAVIAQATASVGVNPNQGPPGTAATVYGTGFPLLTNGRILWDSASGSQIGSFLTNGNGVFTTDINFPPNAPAGQHQVWACTTSGQPVCASATVNVTARATSVPPPAPPSNECEALGIPGEVVVTFEEDVFATDASLRGTAPLEGIRFVGDIDLRVFEPAVDTHSPSHALRTDYAGEFGSAGAMMRLRFTNLQDFVGMYVGLNEQIWATSPISAVLTAYAREESGLLVPVGTDSVSFGPAATPIRQCLSVMAPGIEEVTLTYGGAGEPEVIDDLIIRGPEIPVPAQGDDNPPRITILMPEADQLFTTPYVRLQGEVREDRELDSMSYQLGSGSIHDLGFTPAGITPEGEHLYLFFVDPLPVSELQLCGDNLVQVRAYDTSSNMGTADQTFRIMAGDLSVTEAEAVQVVYGADLVQGKGTAFRVKVRSTFTCPVEVEFLLDLPEDDWSTWPVASGGLLIALPPGYEYPDTWGPVTIPARADDFVVMLPYIPAGHEDEIFGSGNPAGLVPGSDELNPDVRALPRPISSRVQYTVEIDPDNLLPELDETNNRFESPSYNAVSTRPYTFVAFQTHIIDADSECTPSMAEVESAFGRAVDYVLGVFPIADAKIGAVLGAGLQEWNTTTTSRWTFLSMIDELAKSFGGDFGVAMTCHGGGANGVDAVFVGVDIAMETLAHEFNHVVVPMGDIYSLDCYCHWGESYCELADGTRFYCCYDESYDGGEDWISERAMEEAMGVDPGLGCTIDCGTNESYVCDTCCWDSCGAACNEAGGTRHWCPDGRPASERMMLASDGFWANRWLPEEGKLYFMDGPSGDNWMILESTSVSGFPTCWDAWGVGANGYEDLLTNPRFRSAVDPVALLVSGSITRDGQASLNPFIILPEALLDREPGSSGEYTFVLKDGSGNILSQTGFDPIFWQSDPNGGPSNEAYFVLRIEWVEGTQGIDLLDQNGVVLASREVTSGTPEVEITHPAGSVTASNAVTIRWRASDPDGDDLTYSVAISADGGETWLPIAGRLEAERFALPVSALAEDATYLVKVLATDGVNTAWAISSEPFSVKVGLPMTTLVIAGLTLLIAVCAALFLLRLRSNRKASRAG